MFVRYRHLKRKTKNPRLRLWCVSSYNPQLFSRVSRPFNGRPITDNGYAGKSTRNFRLPTSHENLRMKHVFHKKRTRHNNTFLLTYTTIISFVVRTADVRRHPLDELVNFQSAKQAHIFRTIVILNFKDISCSMCKIFGYERVYMPFYIVSTHDSDRKIERSSSFNFDRGVRLFQNHHQSL